MSETPENYLKRFMQTPSTALNTVFDSYIEQFKRRVQERLDEACLRALTEGKHGVKVTTHQFDGSILIEVTEEVPFGEIHYHTELGNVGEYE